MKSLKKGKIIECNCDGCNNQVYVPPRELEAVRSGKLLKFCSTKCSTKTTANGGLRKTGNNIICKDCENVFYIAPHQSNQKFCSVGCANKFKTNKPLLKRRRSIIKICNECGNEFLVQQYRAKIAKYCSNECKDIHTLKRWSKRRYNPESIPIIEKYGNENNYNFKHAENGGEYQVPGTRYFVDGYDIENNIVLEYDESHHFTPDGKLRKVDIERQENIIKILNCKFIRINNNNITIYENK